VLGRVSRNERDRDIEGRNKNFEAEKPFASTRGRMAQNGYRSGWGLTRKGFGN
jgi:hypothetical protein